MAEYTSRIRQQARKEFVLPNPTNWAEIGKVVSAISQELAGERHYDDRVTVEATDEEIVFAYQLTDKVVPA